MAKQTINNGETGLQARTKINDNFTELYNDKLVTVGADGDYASLTLALAGNEKNILVKNGTYIEGTITLSNDGTVIKGESRDGVILQIPSGQDGVRIYANFCNISNLTVDADTQSAEACLVIGDGQSTGSPDVNVGNNNVIEDVKIIGSSTTFALFVAGASYNVGVDTLTAYETGNLNVGNIVRNCYGTSDWNGDSFSFSLQKYGTISNNNFNGRIAFYMCKYSECNNNKVYDTVNQGIFIASPCNDNVISGNVIQNTASAGIKIQNQLEHTPLLTGQNASGNVISDNVIVDVGGSGFEVSGTELHPITRNLIANNSIIRPADHGIYLQDATSNEIASNLIQEPRSDSVTFARGSGIYMVIRVKDNQIVGNTIIDEKTTPIAHTGIANREDSTCTGNVIDSNNIRVQNLERTVWFQSNNTTITNNLITGGYFAGVRLEGASFCTIQNNRLFSNTNENNNAYFEIWIQSGASFNYIDGNFIDSPTTPIANAGVNIDGGCNNNKVGLNFYNGVTNEVIDNGTNNIVKTWV